MLWIEMGYGTLKRMKGMAIGVVVLVLLVGGVFVYHSSYTADPAYESSDTYGGGKDYGMDLPAGDGQFIQAEPDTMPPALQEVVAPDGDVDDAVSSENVVVSMTDVGFAPRNVTVEQGGTVTFVNDGQGAHWPASDDHPTHEILPGFDSKRGLATGEEYSYTFNDVGAWDFHDHLNPQFTGTVTVR